MADSGWIIWLAAGLFVLLPCQGRAGEDAASEGKRYALIIGIDDYSATAYGSLRCAVKDAEALEKALKDPQIGGFDEVRLLTTAQKLRASQPAMRMIFSHLDWLVSNRKQKDMLLFYFAGHGEFHAAGGQQYLIPADGRTARQELGSGADLAVGDIRKALHQSEAKRAVVILDACQNTGARGDQGSVHADGCKGMVTLWSCRTGQRAYERVESGHGAFTYFLLEGLGGAADRREEGGDGDGGVSTSELGRYVTAKTGKWAEQTQGFDKQNPVVEFGGLEPFVMAGRATRKDLTIEPGGVGPGEAGLRTSYKATVGRMNGHIDGERWLEALAALAEAEKIGLKMRNVPEGWGDLGLKRKVLESKLGQPRNRPPVAHILARNPRVEKGQQVILDGSGSQDPDGDPLQYQWTWSGTGLRPEPISAQGSLASFTASTEGTYGIQLVVHDGKAASQPAQAQIVAGPPAKPVFVAVPEDKPVGPSPNGQEIADLKRDVDALRQKLTTERPVAGTVSSAEKELLRKEIEGLRFRLNSGSGPEEEASREYEDLKNRVESLALGLKRAETMAEFDALKKEIESARAKLLSATKDPLLRDGNPTTQPLVAVITRIIPIERSEAAPGKETTYCVEPVQGLNQILVAEEGCEVILDGSDSKPAGAVVQPLKYEWRLIAGSKPKDLVEEGPGLRFKPKKTGSLTWELVVSAGNIRSLPALVKINIHKPGTLPVALPVQTFIHTKMVTRGSTGDSNLVVLDGSKSTCPKGKSLNYKWWQVGGADLGLRPEELAKNRVGVKFYQPGEYRFLLTVSDGENNSLPAGVAVIVAVLSTQGEAKPAGPNNSNTLVGPQPPKDLEEALRLQAGETRLEGEAAKEALESIQQSFDRQPCVRAKMEIEINDSVLGLNRVDKGEIFLKRPSLIFRRIDTPKRRSEALRGQLKLVSNSVGRHVNEYDLSSAPTYLDLLRSFESMDLKVLGNFTDITIFGRQVNGEKERWRLVLTPKGNTRRINGLRWFNDHEFFQIQIEAGSAIYSEMVQKYKNDGRDPRTTRLTEIRTDKELSETDFSDELLDNPNREKMGLPDESFPVIPLIWSW